ncbi:hypothetical protein N7530_010704 [Penicillium desertorum]|uniref:Rhodopsin domain-containing protein n=1 Tax=Penicillium desertorum TaxID=1303715 RepID=A0A9W9WHX5_9EURO|nr:hypothetical protein N7530_010704 [Penicillium desertorum]
MIEIVSVLVSLCPILVVLRVFARLHRRVRFGIDDYLSVVSMVLLIAMLIELILWCSIGGNGAHIADLSPENPHELLEDLPRQPIHLLPALSLYQDLYHLLLPTLFSTSKFQTVTFGLNCLMAAWGTGIFPACAGYVDPDGIPGPQPIWNLHRAWQDKLALNGVFALGAFVCFASIYRIVVLFWISASDPTFTVYQACLWTHIELAVGLICANLPIIRGLFPALKLGSRNGSAPAYINTDHTNSMLLLKSSPRSPDLGYAKMYNAQVQSKLPGPGHLG